MVEKLRVKQWIVLILILVGGCAPAREIEKAAVATGSHFYFVQITDTHWGAKDGMAMTRSAVEMINQLPVKIEFVTLTGDIFSDSIRNEQIVRDGVAVLKELKAPVYCVPGNHDLLQDDFGRTQFLFEENFGPTSQKVMVKGVACLFLCTEIQSGEKCSAWQIERAVIEKMLGTSAEPALIFMHRPPLRDLLGNEGKDAESWGEMSDPRWARLFEKYPGVKGVFAGHFHRDEMVWIGEVPVYAAPALARFWDRQPAFRLYEYKDGRIHYWTLYPERPQKR
ncbi:MAG: metallophosphoesterase [bacterium]|jgi:hypothetical protein